MGPDPRDNRLDFGGDPDHDLDTRFLAGIFKGFFIYYCDFYRHPRIKDESPRRRFELSECFLVDNLFADK